MQFAAEISFLYRALSTRQLQLATAETSRSLGNIGFIYRAMPLFATPPIAWALLARTSVKHPLFTDY